ncbi:zinc-binding protein A33-like isoform X2 [Stegostoma tigrinum]|uniref:zinc-binding protein A33-like isoform X2 n=1 Tax=Stegostoma tigrinum TaxID=3053191 RepID=UPI0028704EAF|nr:zinc-binding protein A33-like isoform X2 [Stegostoma tigrinum]
MSCDMENGNYGEALVCSLCLELFVEPVLVGCDRNYCRTCIESYREAQGGSICCPQCGVSTEQLVLQPNRVLRNVVDKIRRLTTPQQDLAEDERLLCPEHQERLTLVCETDGMIVCLVCRDSKLHKQHRFRERAEFLASCKDKGAVLLNSLNQKVVSLKDVVQKQGLEIAQLKDMGCSLICHIAQQFADLHRFLNEHEQQLLEKLEAHVEGHLVGMEGNLIKLRAILFSTEQDILSIEAKLDQGDLASLKEVSSWRDRLSEETPTVLPGNVCLGTYKGPLQYKLWKEMKNVIHPVPLSLTLDPQTANPWLLLSEDQTSVTVIKTKQIVPDGPARFDVCVSVLAMEGFTSGAHYWEVEVSSKSKWDLGVARESINRKGDIALKPENGYLAISLTNGGQYCALTSPTVTPLQPSGRPSRIGVYVDYEGGQVSFYDAADFAHLYTFTETFTEKIFPYFCPCLNDSGDNGAPLSVVSFQ